tara:strand:- start:1269 stop:2057 length:789 start_codon:yes stop_codon:yes gene_type:complete
MGKIIGLIFGISLGIKFGAIVALILGYLGFKIGQSFDEGLRKKFKANHQNNAYGRFYDFHQQYHHSFRINIPIIPFFGILGHIAKSDGNVSSAEIAKTEKIIKSLSLINYERTQAIHSFRRGKDAHFDFDEACNEIRLATMRSFSTRQLLFKWMLELAQQGSFSQTQKSLLTRAADLLELNTREYVESQDSSILSDAHATLGTQSSDSIDKIKKNYRKLLGQYHPDRLPPDASQSQRDIAADKVIKIKKAYDTISQYLRNSK